MKPKRSRARLAAVLLFYALLAAGATALLWPTIRQLTTPEGQAAFGNWVKSLGAWGAVALLGVQVLQIVVAFLPGEPVEVVAGMLYGTWGGMALCLLGCVLGSAMVFAAVRRFGMPLLRRLFGDKLDSYAFLQDSGRIEMAVFLLFLLPGTPKDMLTYIAGVSRIPQRRFLAISTFARIPSIVTSTLAGDALLGNWRVSLCIFLLTGAVGMLGLRYKERILGRIRRRRWGRRF